MKYIDAEKLIAEIERLRKNAWASFQKRNSTEEQYYLRYGVIQDIISFITSLQQDQPANMIQWTGSNLKEVIDFTGKNPKFGEWFKSWDEFESYVHSHGDILKLFSEDGSHFDVPVGAWIVKTPDGYNVPSVAMFIHPKQEQPEPTCKSCGFYENNCPFIRNNFKPYPNRVCKDYTYSVIKEQEQPDNEEKIINFFDAVGDCGFSQHDILLLKNIWKEAGCPHPKFQVADASKMEQPEVDLEKEEFVGVAESPLKTFPRVNDFECGGSYRH